MARRKNATFTLDQTYGSGDAPDAFIEAFYAELNERYPGKIALPIPPAAKVRPQVDLRQQEAVFLDFVVRKMSPLLFKAIGLPAIAKQMADAPPITVQTTPEELQVLIDLVSTSDDAVGQAVLEVWRAADAAKERSHHIPLKDDAAWKVASAAYRKMLSHASQQSDLRDIFRDLASVIRSYGSDHVYREPTDFATYVARLVAAVAGGGKTFGDLLQPPLYPKETWAAVNEMLKDLTKGSGEGPRFTLVDTYYGSGDGDAAFVRAFYNAFAAKRGKNGTRIAFRAAPIPPPRNVKPDRNLRDQACIVVDCMVGGLLPPICEHVGFNALGAELEALPMIEAPEVGQPITNALMQSIESALDVLKKGLDTTTSNADSTLHAALEAAFGSVQIVKNFMLYWSLIGNDTKEFAALTAQLVSYCAEIDSEVTWDVVNQTLEQL